VFYGSFWQVGKKKTKNKENEQLLKAHISGMAGANYLKFGT